MNKKLTVRSITKKCLAHDKMENGITLIALVITIIVMLILVTVTIRIAANGTLFKHVANATSGTKIAAENENALLDGNLEGRTIEDIVAEQTEVDLSQVQEIHDWQRDGDVFTCTCNECKKTNPEGRTVLLGEQLDYIAGGSGRTTISAERSGIAKAKLDRAAGKRNMEWVDSMGDSQEIKKDVNTEWVVLGREDRNNNGTYETLLLTTRKPTTDIIVLYGSAEYYYWIDEANRIAKELYGENARGMTADDVNQCVEYTPTGGLYMNASYKSVMLDNFTTKLKDLPIWNTLKTYGTITPDPDDEDSETDLGNYLLDGYSYCINDISASNTAKALILVDNTTYILASRGSFAYAASAFFGAGIVNSNSGYVYSRGFTVQSNLGETQSENAFRAVVSLTSKIPNSIE